MTVVSDTTPAARVNPQKKNILIRRLSRAPWWLLAMAIGVIAFVLSIRAQHPYPVIWNAVRQGIWTTIWVSVVQMLTGGDDPVISTTPEGAWTHAVSDKAFGG